MIVLHLLELIVMGASWERERPSVSLVAWFCMMMIHEGRLDWICLLMINQQSINVH